MIDDYGTTSILTTVEQLSERLLEAYVVWLVGGRGAEGMTEPEIMANVKRLPSARWLAMFVADPEMAIIALQSDPRNEFLDGD